MGLADVLPDGFTSLSLHQMGLANPRVLVGLLACGLFALYATRQLTKKRYKLPPGPRPWPIVGNLLCEYYRHLLVCDRLAMTDNALLSNCRSQCDSHWSGQWNIIHFWRIYWIFLCNWDNHPPKQNDSSSALLLLSIELVLNLMFLAPTQPVTCTDIYVQYTTWQRYILLNVSVVNGRKFYHCLAAHEWMAWSICPTCCQQSWVRYIQCNAMTTVWTYALGWTTQTTHLFGCHSTGY